MLAWAFHRISGVAIWAFILLHVLDIWLVGANIAAYDKGGFANHDPERDRKLLLHRREIFRIAGKMKEKGLTLVPLKIYLKKNIMKVEIGLAKGKKSYDKREAIAEREVERQLRRDYAR